MFGFIKKMFAVPMSFFSCNALKCVSINNQEFKIRSQMININIKEPSFYLYSVEIKKCCRSCNNINNSYVKLCVPETVKNINVKIFNLMLRLDTSVCNNKQCWNKDKCRSECK